MFIFEEKENRFFIANSNIPGAGRGVFAATNIKSGDHLLITGVLIEKGSISDRTTCFLDRYKFAADSKIENDTIHIGKYLICPLGFAALVNHTNSRKKQNVEIKYVDEKKYGSMAVWSFFKNVKKGDEILGNYGPGGQHLDKPKKIILLKPIFPKS